MENGNLSWHTESRKVSELKPLEKNPFHKINDRNKARLEEKIRRLGIFEIPTIDLDNSLLTFNKRFHILMTLGRGDEQIDVRVPSRALTDTERKEVILASNIHEGEWDKMILEDLFADIDLDALGLNLNELEIDEDAAERALAEPEDEPEFPVVPTYSEKYDAVIIVCRNEIDFNNLAELLGLENMQCYKSKTQGKSLVVRSEKVIERWKK